MPILVASVLVEVRMRAVRGQPGQVSATNLRSYERECGTEWAKGASGLTVG